MKIPTIHLNGTSKDELLDQTLTAADAINVAIRALVNASPNARDYYPQGNGAYGIARDEHLSRLNRLQDVLQELSDIAEDISDL